MFLRVFTIEDRDKLLEKGYRLLQEEKVSEDKVAYVFHDDNKLSFSKDIKGLRSNKLYF